MNNDLLLLLEALDNVNRNLENVCYDISRRESKPLSQRDISDALRFVDLNEGQILGLGGVLNVVA
jgi:hypothetical protein|tara:strand:+ start:2575 stop:2769 length:195 start_codon:yes stop_codon:yes gene_type:complete